jgi:hypothetical protein
VGQAARRVAHQGFASVAALHAALLGPV